VWRGGSIARRSIDQSKSVVNIPASGAAFVAPPVRTRPKAIRK
jgi:hypothetical protein